MIGLGYYVFYNNYCFLDILYSPHVTYFLEVQLPYDVGQYFPPLHTSTYIFLKLNIFLSKRIAATNCIQYKPLHLPPPQTNGIPHTKKGVQQTMSFLTQTKWHSTFGFKKPNLALKNIYICVMYKYMHNHGL